MDMSRPVDCSMQGLARPGIILTWARRVALQEAAAVSEVRDVMVSRDRIQVTPDRIEAFCRKWMVAELALFGSVLRDDFGPDSDVDVLVTYADEARWTLLDEGRLEEELSELLGGPVDVVSRRSVEHSENWIRRNAILSSAEPLYAAQ